MDQKFTLNKNKSRVICLLFYYFGDCLYCQMPHNLCQSSLNPRCSNWPPTIQGPLFPWRIWNVLEEQPGQYQGPSKPMKWRGRKQRNMPEPWHIEKDSSLKPYQQETAPWNPVMSFHGSGFANLLWDRVLYIECVNKQIF